MITFFMCVLYCLVIGSVRSFLFRTSLNVVANFKSQEAFSMPLMSSSFSATNENIVDNSLLANIAASPMPLTLENVESVLHEVRPYLMEDGGNVRLDSISDSIVYLELEGACVNCPSSADTLKMGIERKLKQRIPTITEVVRVTPRSPTVTIDSIESVLDKIRPVVAVSGCNVEIVSFKVDTLPFPQVALRMTESASALQSVKFEILQRLNRYFNNSITVTWL